MDRDVGELVTAADIARRLGVSGERIRQLAREGRLPPPVGQAGRNTFWLWDTIAGWAEATRRLESGKSRSAPQVWLSERDRQTRFRRVADDVLPFGRNSVVHVRAWRPVGASLRPVVVLGNLDDNEGMSVTNAIEEAALVAAAEVLGADGLDADWYEYWPDHFDDDHSFTAVTFTVSPPEPEPEAGGHARRARRARRLGGQLTNPRWTPVPAAALAELLGEAVELYPYGTYTRDTIQRRNAEGRPRVVWDPSGLQPDVDAAVDLLELEGDDDLRRAMRFAAHRLVADVSKRVKRNKVTARRQPSPLGVELSPYEPSGVRAKIIQRLNDEMPSLPASQLVDAVIDAQQALRGWLLAYGRADDERRVVPGTFGLAMLPAWDVGEDDDHAVRSRSVSAVRHAEARLTDALIELSPTTAAADHPLAVPTGPLDGTGSAAQSYLGSLDKAASGDVDRARAHRLRANFDENVELSYFFDPWGRLVARVGDSFAVEWPLVVSDDLRADAVAIVAEQRDDATPVFVERSAGSLDLLPGTPGPIHHIDFSWGYGGGGPHSLARALEQLVSGSSEKSSEFARVYGLIADYEAPVLRLTLDKVRRLMKAPR